MRRREFVGLVGVAAIWPLFAYAQQLPVPVIGFMSSRSPDESKHLLAAFHQGLSETGFIEGKNEVSNIDGHLATMANCQHWQLTS